MSGDVHNACRSTETLLKHRMLSLIQNGHQFSNYFTVILFLSDWQAMCIQLGELHQNGDLSTEHVKVSEQFIVVNKTTNIK